MPSKKWYLPGLIIVGLIFLVYVPSLSLYLRGDDFEWLNTAYTGWRHPPELLRLINNFFRPLAKVTFLLNYTCVTTHILFYNLTTIGFHVINVFLLYTLLVKVTHKWQTATLIAVTYGISSFYSEVPLWSGVRPDSLLPIFILAGLILLNTVERKFGIWQQGLLVCLSLGAMGTKESWVLFPFLAVSFLWLVKHIPLKTALKATLSVFLLLSVYLVIFIGIPLLSHTAPPTSYADSHPQASLLKFCYMLARYCGLGDLYTGADWQSLVILLSALSMLGWLIKSRNRLALWGMVWMLLTICISLPIYYAPSRYNYLPLMGFWIMTIGFLEKTLEAIRSKIEVNPLLLRLVISMVLLVYLSYHIIMLQWEIRDYKEFGNFHQQVVTLYQAVKAQIPFDQSILFFNQGLRRPTSEIEQSYKGYPKLLFRRDTGIWELINFDALANFTGKPFDYLVRSAPTAAIKQILAQPCTVVIFTDAGFNVIGPDPVFRQKVHQFYEQYGRLPDQVFLYQITSTGS
jgi:hypothetical protein